MSDEDDERRKLTDKIVDALWESDEKPQQRVVNDDVQLVQRTDEQRSRYVQRALSRELTTLAEAQEGARNDALNRASFNLGQLIGAGVLDEQSTRDALTDVARRIGLTASETRGTIESGISKGRTEPRELSMTQLVTRNDTSSADAPFGTVAGGGEQPPVEPPSEAELDDFWAARPLLAHVHLYARSRLVAPWAVLGCVLARVIAATPPTVVLPPMVGSHASLNLFVGLVGPSGAGKGAAERVAAECLMLGQTLKTATCGSGEAIAHGFVKREQGQVVPHSTEVLFSVPEIDTLSALGNRQGATLMPELRRAWSGEALGFQYVDKAKSLPVEAHSYRMSLIAGIQPARAGTLLDDSDGGTPQRFVWCTATDRHAPDETPETPRPMTWRRPSFGDACERDAFTSKNLIRVCDTARAAVKAERLARTRGTSDPLDGHKLLAQLKVAAALSIADGRCDITDDDWQLAATVMKQSDATRASVAQTLSGAERQKNVMRAEAEADRAVLVSDREHEASLRRACRAILRKLNAADEHAAPRRVLRTAVQHRDRSAYDEACSTLVTAGQIAADLDRSGEWWKLT